MVGERAAARIVRLTLAWVLVGSWCVSFGAEFSDEATALPFPPDARNVEFTAWSGDVEFTSRSPLKSLAAFYLKEMAARGWELDESEVDIEDDSIELVFTHGDAEVELSLRQRSKKVKVSLDTEALKFTDVDDPAKLEAAGIRVPRATLFMQKEIKLPAGVQDLEFDADGCSFKSSQKLQESFDNFNSQIKSKGFRESRRPIVTDTRRYTEFKKGSAEVSVNVFTHAVGSRVILEYEDDRPEPKVAPLPPVASLPIGNPGSPEESMVSATPAKKQPINVVSNKGQAVVTYGGKKYTFKHVACYQTKDRGDYATEVVFASKPIPLNKMQAMIASQDDFSFGQMYEFDMPQYFMLQLGDYQNLSFSADGTGIGGYELENETGELKIEGNRVQGTLTMPPKEILNRGLSFNVTIDAAIITPNTRFSTGAPDPVEKTNNPVFADSPVPMPTGAEDVSRQGSKFRKEYSAVVAMPIPQVAEFYRNELTAKGWQQVGPQPTNELLNFRNREMDMVLTFKRQGSETSITAVTRDAALAKRAGILPEPGTGRLILANAHTQRVVYSIGKTDYPLRPGQGAKELKQALNYSIPPGTYNIVVKIPGQPPQTERIKLTEGSAWSIVALPTGGYLPVQLY